MMRPHEKPQAFKPHNPVDLPGLLPDWRSNSFLSDNHPANFERPGLFLLRGRRPSESQSLGQYDGGYLATLLGALVSLPWRARGAGA